MPKVRRLQHIATTTLQAFPPPAENSTICRSLTQSFRFLTLSASRSQPSRIACLQPGSPTTHYDQRATVPSLPAYSSSSLQQFRLQGFHTRERNKMASDEDYTAFLDKANQDAGGATTQSSKKVGAKSVDTEVPKILENIEEYYTSDADEPFEPVSLKFSGSSISSDELKKLLEHGDGVESVSERQFGQYKKVLDAVKKAGNGKVEVFRVDHGGTRAEYYVVSVDEKDGRLVGLKALAVES